MKLRIQSDAGQATISLNGFALKMSDRRALMKTIANGQLVSVYKTFREQGSPSGSWPQLSPASRRWHRYTSGHQLLILSGRGRNSITPSSDADTATLSTNVGYMVVHQFGFDGDQIVKPYSYTRVHRGPGKARVGVRDKNDHLRTVTRKIEGPSSATTVQVRGFTRHIRIPARPFAVLRPEDPSRIEAQVRTFLADAAARSGLETK